jgi:hypothetical protein
MDRRDNTVRNAKRFLELAVAANVSDRFTISIPARSAGRRKVADEVGRWMGKGLGCTKAVI